MVNARITRFIIWLQTFSKLANIIKSLLGKVYFLLIYLSKRDRRQLASSTKQLKVWLWVIFWNSGYWSVGRKLAPVRSPLANLPHRKSSMGFFYRDRKVRSWNLICWDENNNNNNAWMHVVWRLYNFSYGLNSFGHQWFTAYEEHWLQVTITYGEYFFLYAIPEFLVGHVSIWFEEYF